MQSEADVGKLWVPTVESFKSTAKSFTKFETLKKALLETRMIQFLGVWEI